MPNPVDQVHERAVTALRVERERMTAYKAQYTEQDAQRLGDAYMQYPWVSPEILVSVVLSGQDDLLPAIADYAGVQAARSGWSPVEQSQRDDMQNNLTGATLDYADKFDDDGDMLLKAMLGDG